VTALASGCWNNDWKGGRLQGGILLEKGVDEVGDGGGPNGGMIGEGEEEGGGLRREGGEAGEEGGEHFAGGVGGVENRPER